MKRLIPVIVLAMVLASGSAWAADATANLDVMSAYVWRGITFNDNPVLQPSIDVSKNGFGLNVWGNYDYDEYVDGATDNELSEVDLTFYYGFAINKLDVTVGYIEYLFPNTTAESTREVYTSLSLPLFGGLSAGLNFYYDFDEIESYYTDLGLSYEMELMDKLSMTLGAKIGYAGEDFAEAYNGTDADAGLHDYNLSAGLAYAATEALSIGAKIAYTDSLDSDVLSDGLYAHDVELYGGLTVSYAF